MERNRLKHRLAQGQLCLTSGNHVTSDLIDYVGSLGSFDGVWIDMEHTSVTMADLADMSRAADIWGMTSLVRVRAADPALITLTMSEGVDGIIVPNVKTREEAERIVDAAKFGPIGHRGASGGRRSYGTGIEGRAGGLHEYYKKANDDTFVAIMIEDIVGAKNLPEILKVPHIDMIHVGRYDFAQSMGLMTDTANPRRVQAFDEAIQQIVRAGKVAAAALKDEEELRKYIPMGVRCVKIPSWRWFIRQGAMAFAESAKAAAAAAKLQPEVGAAASALGR
jgi:4-hydroxy-2-oxoheptanedioate aldolase